MSRPQGTNPNLRERIAEWSLVRRTATLGDVVDEATFIAMLNVPTKTFRHYATERQAFGIPFPQPIARPDGIKPIWLKKEAEAFRDRFKGARAARRK